MEIEQQHEKSVQSTVYNVKCVFMCPHVIGHSDDVIFVRSREPTFDTSGKLRLVQIVYRSTKLRHIWVFAHILWPVYMLCWKNSRNPPEKKQLIKICETAQTYT